MDFRQLLHDDILFKYRKIERIVLFLVLTILVSASCCKSTEKEDTPVPVPFRPDTKAMPESISPKTLTEDQNSNALVVLLGTGTPVPSPDRSGPSTAIIAGNQAYLVDFGPGVVRRASAAFKKGIAQLNMRSLTRAFATHLHSDHTAGFSDLILSPAVIGRPDPLIVYGPPGIKNMTEHILAAYKEDLGVRSQRHTKKQMRGYQVQTNEIVPGPIYEDKNVKVTAFPVHHGSWKHAFGYRFDAKNRSIVISGDTGPAKTTIEACNGCDVLVHEVYCTLGFERGPPSWQKYHANYHTSTKELAQLAAQARPKLLVMYHQLFFGCSEKQIMDEVSSRYKGKTAFGNDLEVY